MPTLKTKPKSHTGMNPAKLSDTSAFVSLLAGDTIHTSAYSNRYRTMLDLSAGMYLLNECRIFHPYLEELVKNRKWFILNEAIRDIRRDMRQVVILGSGLDTLSLELAWLNDSVMIYDVDMAQMKLKEKIIGYAAPNAADRIRCVAADLAQTKELVRKMQKSGWDESKASVVILEGISYYLKPEQMWEGIRCLDRCKKNTNILEYITPAECIQPDRAGIPDGVFDIIQKSVSGSMQIERFSYGDLSRQAQAAGYDIVSHSTMQEIEKRRTGTNRYFPTVSSGWVETVLLRSSAHS